jgi:quinol monooxygenase YgiN
VIHLNVLLTVKDARDIDRVQALLHQQATAARDEPGCLRFEVYHSQSDRRVFLLVERWATQAHVEQHRQGKSFLELYQPLVLPLVERTPHPSDLVG